MKSLKSTGYFCRTLYFPDKSMIFRTSLNSRLNEIDELASDSDYEENARIIFMVYKIHYFAKLNFIYRSTAQYMEFEIIIYPGNLV